ncbi:chloride channel protein [Rhizobium sp. NPDC090279]|uniref:chloride channel protein n=1 Tax=Rhizobium sp. NPDC090279 TaxID=3364499 RepID=UPI00383ADA3E
MVNDISASNVAPDVGASSASFNVAASEDFNVFWRFPLAVLFVGVFAGLSGMLLALLLHVLQHVAFGYSLDVIIGHVSFLEGVEASSSVRRVAVLLACGAIAGVGWWAVYTFGRPLVSIRKAVANPDAPMPVVATTGHALLQIITVALGSPLGREVAPREIGALIAGLLGRTLGLSRDELQILIACGAGAGLAAVYNVPFAGALFTLEVLLVTFKPKAAIAALFTSAISSYVAWIGLGDESQYVLPPLDMGFSLVIWAAIGGPVFGCAGFYYRRLAAWARENAPRASVKIIPYSIAAFGLIGLASIGLPQLLGNGRGPIQLGLNGNVTIGLAMVLLLLKLIATTLSLRAGAEGGLLTPGMTIGALLAIILGGIWNAFGLPPIVVGASALIGAGAFLAVSMSMPLTAIALAFEFTGANRDFYIPILVAVSLAVAGAKLLENAELARTIRRKAAIG